MPKSNVVSVFWTDRALQNAIAIRRYLTIEFSAREVDKFLSLLSAFEIAVSAFPALYPMSSIKPGIRRAVLNKAVSVFYRIHKHQIEVLAILDNRCDLTKLL